MLCLWATNKTTAASHTVQRNMRSGSPCCGLSPAEAAGTWRRRWPGPWTSPGFLLEAKRCWTQIVKVFNMWRLDLKWQSHHFNYPALRRRQCNLTSLTVLTNFKSLFKRHHQQLLTFDVLCCQSWYVTHFDVFNYFKVSCHFMDSSILIYLLFHCCILTCVFNHIAADIVLSSSIDLPVCWKWTDHHWFVTATNISSLWCQIHLAGGYA